MPSASSLYIFPGINNEINYLQRIPCFQREGQNSNSSKIYDSIQSLTTMTEHNFNSGFLPNPPKYSTYTESITGNMMSPSSYFTPEYTCMYTNNSVVQQRTCDDASNESTIHNLITKKGFRNEREDMFNEQDQLLSWTRKHPENWSPEEVLDWLIYTGQERGLNMSELRAEAFQNICGVDLCKLSVDDFINLEPKYGKSFHEMLHQLLTVTFQKPSDIPSDYQELAPYNTRDEIPSSFAIPTCSIPQRKHELSNGVTHTDVLWRNEQSDNCNTAVDNSSFNFDVSSRSALLSQTLAMPEMDTYVLDYAANSQVKSNINYNGSFTPVTRRRPGRPRNKQLNGVEDSKSQKDKKVKNQHLWEFIYDCLINPAYNPQYLRWENQRDGVFRFVQSETVAQLWGSFKNNENMTYEKLSRAMRHYYKRGILERVEGRRLVYKFSRKAMDRARDKHHITL